MPHALISGASIAGLSSAFWLQRTGWSVTVLERSESFRAGGQNIDLRGAARAVLDRMGLTGDVRAQNTTERGTIFVDADDRPIGEFRSMGTTARPPSPTSSAAISRASSSTICRRGPR